MRYITEKHGDGSRKEGIEVSFIEKWKNRETKRSLREENIFLRAENERLSKDIRMIMDYPPNVCTIDRNVQRAVARKALPHEVYARYQVSPSRLFK